MFSKPALSVSHLSKQFKLYNRPADRLWEALGLLRSPVKTFSALSNVSFELNKGEVLGIIGRNGAGKSTLLQLICGTLRPSSGSIQVSGRIAALLELGSGFNPEFSGRDNVYMNASVLGLSKSEIDAKFNEIVAFAELESFIDQPVKAYSSGMFVRLAFAVATSVEPDILIIDEALSVGDGAFARKSFDRIMSLREAGVTILFCSHALYQVEALCDRAIWLKDGQAALVGDVQSVTSAYQSFLSHQSTSPEQHLTMTAENNDASSLPTSSQPRIQSVTIGANSKTINNEKIQLISDHDDAWIDINFLSPLHVPPPTIAVVITNGAGVQVCSFSTHIDNVSIADGQSFIRLVLPKIPLLKGIYEVDVFLLCENGIHVYEHVRHAAQFIVIQNHLEVGVVHIARHWQSNAK